MYGVVLLIGLVVMLSPLYFAIFGSPDEAKPGPDPREWGYDVNAGAYRRKPHLDKG